MKCQLCQVFVRILEDVKEKENKIMARKDYDQFADELIAAVGGKENIVSVTNCMTRLRFVLADESIVKDDEVKKIKGVMSVVHGAGQYQIPIGTYVSDLCPVVKAKLGLTEDAMAAGKAKAESMRVVKKDSFFNKFFKAISGCILPMIAPMAAGGIIKGFLTILTTFGVLTSDNGIYLILYAAADALMYFMPIIVGFSAGKVFGMNPYTAAVIGAAMLYPKLAAFVGAEETLTFFGLKVTMLDYSQTMLPILLAVFVASWIEKAAKKIIPQMLQLMFVPTVVLVITLPLTLLVVGPVMAGVSNALATGVNALYNAVPVVCGGVLGAFWQLFVMMGVHSAILPIILNNLTTLGYCPVNAILGLTVWALAGVALGYALKVKDGETRATAFGTMASALCGITEPVLFGVTMKIRTNMIAAMAGGGVSGFFMGLMNTKNYSGGSPGLLTLPSYIGLDTPMTNFYYACAGAAIAFVVAFIVSFVLFRDEKKN